MSVNDILSVTALKGDLSFALIEAYSSIKDSLYPGKYILTISAGLKSPFIKPRYGPKLPLIISEFTFTLSRFSVAYSLLVFFKCSVETDKYQNTSSASPALALKRISSTAPTF